MRPLLLLMMCAWTFAAGAWARSPAVPDRSLEQLVTDYIGLYTRDTLPRWQQLFLPGFSSASTNDDGSVTVRTLDAFYAAQERGFAQSRAMGERLENVRIERHGALASVWADFVFWADGPPSRGKLVLLAVHQVDGWRIHSLMFSYAE